MFKKKTLPIRRKLTSFQVIILSFLFMIIVGTLLLMLPFSSQSGKATSLSDAMFTAVSAVCVTGLVVKDTATYWSMFGQFIIITLIQIGGMGVITVGLSVIRTSGKKIRLWQRSAMQDSISAPKVGGIVRITGFILKGCFLIELSGAILLYPVFCRDFGALKGLWYSFFHSVSAFCNAGFDLMGVKTQFSSLCSYRTSIYLNIVIMLLIIIGGIGFFTWDDVVKNKLKFKRYSLQSKIVLVTSGLLILIPALYFFFFEYADLSIKERTISSVFQSVTTRTAGFNTQDLARMNQSGTAVMIFLMLIGGSPSSTAGGMKTVTFAVIFLTAITVFSRKNDVSCFKRRISDESVRNAGAILFMYIILFFTSAGIISYIEGLPLLTCMFETASAIGTVGLTLGITSSLSLASKTILMLLMFFGRVGGLTLIYAALPSPENLNSRLPLEKISVG